MIHHRFLAICLVLVAKPTALALADVLSNTTKPLICPKQNQSVVQSVQHRLLQTVLAYYGEICCPGEGRKMCSSKCLLLFRQER
jgi:hypothetical protein